MARLTLRGTSRLLALAAIAIAPACSFFEPDTGAPLTACVDGDSNPNVKVSFANDIRPIMDGRVVGPKPCADCHYADRGTQEGINEAGLRLATLGALRKGGNRTGPDIVVKGQPCASPIIQKLRGTFGEGARMPKGGPYWNQEQIQLFMDWISEGAEGGDME